MRDIMRFRVLGMVLLALGLFAGSFSAAGAQDPDDNGTPGTDEPGTVVISTFVCTQIEEPTATVSGPVGVGAAAGEEPEPPEEGCVADSADFQVFVNSDFTSDPIDVFVDGTATVNGVPSTEDGVPNALFEPSFNVFFEFDITPGGVTTITVRNPADDGDGATPVVDGDDDSAADDGDNGAVSGLPSTGEGGDGGASGSAIVLLLGAMSTVALAAGFAWRQRRTA